MSKATTTTRRTTTARRTTSRRTTRRRTTTAVITKSAVKGKNVNNLHGTKYTVLKLVCNTTKKELESRNIQIYQDSDVFRNVF